LKIIKKDDCKEGDALISNCRITMFTNVAEIMVKDEEMS